MENVVAGNVVNEIAVDEETRAWALVALDRMIKLTEKTS
jgi:quinolinate synthase